MSAFKIVGRYKEKENQESWNRGKPLTQAKKRTYINEEDFNKYSPKLIERWERLYYVEVYENINDVWELYNG